MTGDRGYGWTLKACGPYGRPRYARQCNLGLHADRGTEDVGVADVDRFLPTAHGAQGRFNVLHDGIKRLDRRYFRPFLSVQLSTCLLDRPVSTNG